MSTTHPHFPDYGWAVPPAGEEAHYVKNARLIGKAGWLGWTLCSMKTGGNAPLTSVPVGKPCKICAAKANYVGS